ncbi:MAG TPA: nucleoside-diphosphate sugar epimerase/dehydratase [Actinomycetota bacterium]
MRLRRDVPLAFLDMGLVLAAYLAPLVLRFEGEVPGAYWNNFIRHAPLITLIHLLSNYLFGLYGQMWRYASIQEARRVVLAGLTSGVLVVGSGFISSGPTRPMPLSVLVMGATIALVGIGAIRFQSRLFALRRRTAIGNRRRVLVMGAGDAASTVLLDILRNQAHGLDPVGVVDDDPRKLGLTLHGMPILGSRQAIPSLVPSHEVDEVLLAIPSVTGEVVQEVAGLCEQAGVPLRVLPSMREVVGGRVSARDIRDLRIEDLLGRQQVETDLDAVRTLLHGKRVLVTGAGGSIGAEIVRQVASFDPATVVLLDHDETHLHDAMVELGPREGLVSVLADIRERDRVLGVFTALRPQVVFHAAAHKHVDILESQPAEALLTNVMGTANVVDASVATGVSRFVLISTDKAVHPASVMGASKWFAEQIVRSLHGSGMTLCAVRFGNVLGSRGSVIPTFFRQIARGGPVTVTDPSMARYFMSVQEAVQLVLQAGAMAEGGEVFTLDMGQPVNILDLARRLIRLSGRVPGRDIEIEIIGARPGEKLVEEVSDPDERVLPSGHPSIVVSGPPVPSPALLREALFQLESLAREGMDRELATRMKDFARQSLRQEVA